MADQELRIKIVIDDSQPRASQAARNKALSDEEKAAKRVADEKEKADKKAAEAAVAAARREADEKAKQRAKDADDAQKARQKQADDAKKQAERTAAELQRIQDRMLQRDYSDRVRHEARMEQAAQRRAERDAINAQKAKERETALLQRITDRYLLDEYNSRVRAQQRIDRLTLKAITDEEVARRVANARMAQSNQARIDSAMRLAGMEKEGFDLFKMGAEAAAGAAMGLVGSLAAMAAPAAIVSLIAQSFSDAQKSAIDASKFALEYRDALLEIAALKGRLGDTTPELQESLMFRARTLQSRDQATQFQNSALNIGASVLDDDASGVKKLVSKEEFAKAMELGGSFQAAEGGSAKVHGQLIGMIPALMNRRMTGEEIASKEAHLFNIFQQGGAEFSSMTSGFLENSPLADVAGITPERLAALESGLSTVSPDKHAAYTRQFVRATAGGIGRLKGVKVEGESEKVGEYLRGIGAKEGMDPIEIGKKIADDLERAKITDKRAILTYLQEKGYGNDEDRLALAGFAKLKRTGQWEKTFEPLADEKSMPQGKEAMQNKVENFQKFDPAASKRRTDISADMSKVAIGSGPVEYYRQYLQQTFHRLKAQGKITGEFDGTEQGWGLLDNARRMMVEAEATQGLENEAKRVGLAPRFAGQQIATGMGFAPGAKTFVDSSKIGYEEKARAMYDAANAIGAAGGNREPGNMEAIKEILIKSLEEQKKLREMLNNTPGFAAPGARPPGGAPPAAPAPLKPAPAMPGGVRP